jgi:hypothetical protein
LLLLLIYSALSLDTSPPHVELLWPDSGAYVSCADIIVEMLIVDREFWVDRSSILLTVNNLPHWFSAIDESTFSWVDSFYYFPFRRPVFDGDSIWCLMSPVADYDDNYSDGFNWFFYIDFTGPEITNLSPAPFSEVTNPHQPISARVYDRAGLTEDSCYITINGMEFDLFEGYAAWIADTFVFYSGLAGLFFAGGDTIDVCVHSADAAEGCGANHSDTCWWFTLPQGGPTAEFVWPNNGRWVSCVDTVAVFRIIDSEGVEEDSIRIVVGAESWTTADPELTWSPPFLYWNLAGRSEGAIAGTLYASDIIGNPMDPPLAFNFGLDFSPPYLLNENPPHTSAVYNLNPVVFFELDDILAGMMHSPTLAGVSVDGSPRSWFSLSSSEFSLTGSTYRLDSLAIPPIRGGDTISVRVIAYDSVSICATNRLDTTWFFYIPYTPPVAHLILPDSGSVSACADQGIWFYLGDDEGIRENTILVRISGYFYNLASPELTYSNDTLRFTPSTPWAHGSYISGSLYYAEDVLSNPLAERVRFGFYVDLRGPEIVSYSPPEFSLSSDTLRQVRIRIEDVPAGLDPSSVVLTVKGVPRTVDGTSTRWEDPFLIYDPLFAGAWDDVDSVEICLTSAFDDPDTCPANPATPFCWTFYIDARDPVASPPEGAIVACVDQAINLYLWAPGGIIDGSILIEINGTPYTTADPRLFLTAGDTLVFEPDSPWPDGDSVRCLLVHAEGNLGSSIDSVYWGFLMDYSAPLLISANPAPGEVVSIVDPPVNFVLIDSISGLLPGAFQLTFNGSSFGWGHSALSIAGNSFTLNLPTAGIHISGGDTAVVCIHAEDFAFPEYCGPNVLDTCYSFSIEAGGPVAELVSPPGLIPYACDSNIVIVVDDHNGYLWATLEILIDGTVYHYGDPELSISGDTIIIAHSHVSGDTLRVVFAQLQDSLENNCTPAEWFVLFDHEPPVLEWVYPSAGTTLTFTDLTAIAVVRDNVTSSGINVLEGYPYTLSGDTLFFDFASLADYDTIEITLEVFDFADCANHDTSAIRFYMDAAPPVADLIFPEDFSWTLCDPQQVRILLTDPSGINPSGLQVRIGGDVYGMTDPNLRLSGDTLIFDPDTAFLPGSVDVEIIYARDRWGNVLDDFYAIFYQQEPPIITNLDPGPAGSSSTTSPEITVDYAFADSAWIEIDGAIYIESDLGFAYTPDGLAFDTDLAGLSWTAGDTIDVCAFILAEADYCGPAVAETCWSFYIQYSPPVWSFIFPECSSWTACEYQNFVLSLFDDDGIDEFSIQVSANGVIYDISAPELVYDDFLGELEFTPSVPFVEGTVTFCLLAVSDVLGASAGDLPSCCEMFLDQTPPDGVFMPSPGEYLPVPGTPVEIEVVDMGAGARVDSASVNGVWVYPSDDELIWSDPTAYIDIYPLLALPTPDSVVICLYSSDLVEYCAPNDTVFCAIYPLNIDGPIIDMVSPGNGAVTSCANGPLEFTAVDTHLIDSTTVRLVLDGIEITPPDSRLTFPNDSTIVFTPDTAWRHGATICGTLTVEDTLGAMSEPYDFCITIDIEPPQILFYSPFADIIDTFSAMRILVEDAPAGIDYTSPIITVGGITVYREWHGDTIVIPRDSLNFCEFDTLEIVLTGLSDMAVVCGANTLTDSVWSFAILDDDTLGPIVGSFSPGSANSGIAFVVTSQIVDTSGVHSAYILWSAGEELTVDADSVAMSEFTPGIWASIDSIGPVFGDWATVAVCAWDNDFDCENPLDRSLACDTFLVPLYPLSLVQVPISHGSWNPSSPGDPLCVGEKFGGGVMFVNPDTITLYADSICLSIGEIISVRAWSDTALATGESLYVPLELLGDTDGDFVDTLKIFDLRFTYPIGMDTVFASLMFCDFKAGPNPFSPNDDGIYDEFKLELPRTGDIEISFYRLEGQHVATLRGNGRLYAWNGRDDRGHPQPPGIYLWVVRIDGDVYKHGSVTLAR